MKTEDIPSSLFHERTKPRVGADKYSKSPKQPEALKMFSAEAVEQNGATILSFLATNCKSSQGSGLTGSYWLRRDAGDTNMRLYDLSTLASSSHHQKWKYMMAMMCYRYAIKTQRVHTSSRQMTEKLQRRRRELLLKSLQLLEEINCDSEGTAGSDKTSSRSYKYKSIASAVHEQLYAIA